MDELEHPGAIDMGVIDSLRELDADEGSGLLGELVDLFVEDAAAHIEALQQALASNDAVRLERTAHTLKSSSASIGAAILSELCLELEKIGRAGDLAGAPETVHRAALAYDEARQALSTLRP